MKQKGKFYDQIDGVAMQSPVLANLLMDHHEKEWLSNYIEVSPSYYVRYVDDIFWFSIRTMKQHDFSLILIQDTLISN